MSDIRVTYSGLIALIGGLAGVIFGLGFILIVTRSLSPEEFGTWALLLSIVNYLLISEAIISVWTIRQIARGELVGKTSVLSSGTMSLFILPVFVVYAFFVSESNQTEFEILLLGAALIPVSFVSQTLASINYGHKPHAVTISHIIFQIIKIPIALLTVLILDLAVLGVVLAVFFAFVGKILVQLYYARYKIKEKFSLRKLKWWLRYSWIPLFTHTQNFLHVIDITIYSIIIGSVIGVAYFQVAYSIAAIIQHSGTISKALYPKLLSEKNYGGIQQNFTRVLYFGILLLGITIVFSKPALFALNPLYELAWPVVIIISFRLFLNIFKTIPVAIIVGTEQVDTEINPKFSRFLKSSFFRMPKYLGFFNLVYILALALFLLFFKDSGISEIELVSWWALFGLILEIPILIFLWSYSRKFIKISFPITNSLKYVLAMLAFVGFFMITSDMILNYAISIYDFLPTLLLELVLCVGIYLVITYLIDRETRTLFKSILTELKK